VAVDPVSVTVYLSENENKSGDVKNSKGGVVEKIGIKNQVAPKPEVIGGCDGDWQFEYVVVRVPVRVAPCP
jgi:hypothetical protein